MAEQGKLPPISNLARSEFYEYKYAIAVQHMTPDAAEAFKRRAEADEKIAKSNAEAAAAVHALPAQEERKREVRKTGIIAFAILAIVVVTAVVVPEKDRSSVLIWCAATLGGAWTVTEGIKSVVKAKSKALPPAPTA